MKRNLASPAVTAVGLVLAAVLTTSTPAHADGARDPGRAQADANAALHDLHAFCERPRMPPTRDSVRLCSLAEEVPNCKGFTDQCAALLKQEEPSIPSPIWASIVRAIAAVAPALGWLTLALGIGTILYLIGRAIWARIRRPAEEAEPEPEASVTVTAEEKPVPIQSGSAESLLERAEAALARGDLRAALFGFLHAALRALDVRGAIRIARDRTNGEYLRSCADEGARPELRAIVREVDVVQFGGREPELERVRDAGRRAALLVRAVTSILLIAALVPGCGSMTERVRANDPAGFDVARELLTRQGFNLKPPPVPLARLEPPKADDAPPPPMLLDVSKTALDTDAVDGLERWVKGGGRLIVVGPTWAWPAPFKARFITSDARDVEVQHPIEPPCDEATDDCEEKTAAMLERASEPARRARLAHGASFKWEAQQGRPIAVAVPSEPEGGMYAGVGDFDKGLVLGIASSDLLTNIGLARDGNPAALVTLLSHVVPGPGELMLIDEHGGITPSSDPLSSLLKAGLGLPLAHVLLFVAVLAFAVGARSRAARPLPTPARRAFVEHVEATAALYAFARATPHALASYGRFVVERMRTRLSKGSDLAGTLAQRSGVPRDEVQQVLDRASLVRAGDAKRGDELATLRSLAEIYTRAEGPLSGTKSKLRLGRRR